MIASNVLPSIKPVELAVALPQQRVMGVPIHAATMQQAVELCDNAIRLRTPLVVGVVNAAKLVNMRRDPLLRSRLKGNFVLVNNESLSVADTRTGLGLASVSAEGGAAAEIPAASGETAAEPAQAPVFSSGNVSWIPMVVGGLLIAILVVIIIAAITRRRVVMH